MADERKNLANMLPVTVSNGRGAVNARDLYLFLESKQDFSTWIKNRIEQYGFEENVDYQILAPQKNGASWGGSNKIEYALSIDMAKELSMVERTDKGKQARTYFLDCERKVYEGIGVKPKREPSLMTKMRLGVEWVKNVSEVLNLNDVSKLGLLNKVAKPLNLPMPDYVPSKGVTKSATELLKENNINISTKVFNQKAIEKGFLQELTRKSSKGEVKKFKAITKKGEVYGENQLNQNNPNETQPHYYVDKFPELIRLLEIA